jgi:integrase
MLKKNWPKIRERTIDGHHYFVVDTRRYQRGVRIGKEEYFTTKKRAEGRADVIRSELIELGSEPANISHALRADALRAEEMLKPYGVTVIQAVAEYVKQRQNDEKRTRLELGKAIDKFLVWKTELKDAGRYNPRSLKAAQKRLGHLKKAFPDKCISDFKADDFERWLLTAQWGANNNQKKYSAASQAGIKSISSEFFKWCMRQGWIEINPAQFLRIQRDDHEVQILTPPQAGELIKAAQASPFHQRAVPYVLLGLFAGLRPSEAEDLQREDINDATAEIRVASRKLRGQVRYVPMAPELAARLREMKWDGKLAAENWRKQFESVKLGSKNEQGQPTFTAESPFPPDGLRHSFASYWLAKTPDRARLAEIMGNSVDVIRNHYRKAIPITEANNFWELIIHTDKK